MPILIDGHNLIGRLSAISLQDPDDEEQLIQLLASHRARMNKKITVVFDPGGAYALSERRRSGGISVVFASHGSSADAVIAQLVRASRDRRGWLVITSDQQLADAVTRLGARVQSAEAFAAELQPASSTADDAERESLPAEKAAPPSAGEVEAWLALFEERDRQRPDVS